MCCMQHTIASPEEGLKEGWNDDKEYANVQHYLWDPSNNMKSLDTEEHYAGTKAVWS